MNSLIDTHSHLFVEEFDKDRALCVARAKAAGVSHLYLPNIDLSSIHALLDMVDEYPDYCTPMVGLHPTSVDEGYLEQLIQLKAILDATPNRFAAIGEIGIDLYWNQTYRNTQMKVFDTQISWAEQYNLPIVIHQRNAFKETIEIVKQHSSRGIFHSFSGSAEEARELIALSDYLLGINGVVTFKKSTLPEVLQTEVPLNRIVLETDCPYLTPAPHRGKRNESSYLPFILNKLSEIYGVAQEVVAQVTTENACLLFETKSY
ncbi:MAG: TatD family hydrolase [Bacteroidaceae bacterium]